jgi:hypothetical protein
MTRKDVRLCVLMHADPYIYIDIHTYNAGDAGDAALRAAKRTPQGGRREGPIRSGPTAQWGIFGAWHAHTLTAVGRAASGAAALLRLCGESRALPPYSCCAALRKRPGTVLRSSAVPASAEVQPAAHSSLLRPPLRARQPCAALRLAEGAR